MRSFSGRTGRPPHATEDERDLFHRHFRDAKPLRSRRARPHEPAPAKPAPVKQSEPVKPVVSAIRAPTRAPHPNPGLDRATERRVARGEMKIDRRIDLHGLTLEDAHAALDRFVRQAVRDGARMLLVITGKGTRSEGAIKREAPHWLRRGEQAAQVLRILPARAKHGGEGALYVLLRRKRD